MAGKQLHVNFNEDFNLDALIHLALDEVQNRYRTDNLYLLENDDLEAIILKKLPKMLAIKCLDATIVRNLLPARKLAKETFN